MPTSVSDNIEGFDELMKQFEKLSDSVGKKTVRQSLSSSANLIVKEMRERMPKGTEGHRTYKGRWVAPGFSSRSLRKKIRSRGKSFARVDVVLADEAWYAMLYEKGYKRKNKRTGQVTEYPARPWIKPSADTTEDRMFNLFADQMTNRVRKALKK